ncbi:MAG: hypothetical protein ACSLFB_01135 [Acidimicrobiales bacterium]
MVVAVTAIHAPEVDIVGQRLVVVVCDAKELCAQRALPPEEPVFVNGHIDTQDEMLAILANVLDTFRKAEVAAVHAFILADGCDIDPPSSSPTLTAERGRWLRPAP